ncbi:MAG: hypothetical protein Q4P71_02750 [Actinomycetaceae bacterium]|nr:hypothetical protein [Actinomycetaceae bacterium]
MADIRTLSRGKTGLLIFDFAVLGKHKRLGGHLGGLGIAIHEGQEDASALLGMEGEDGEHSASGYVNSPAAQVERVFVQISLNSDVYALNLVVLDSQ